MVNKTSSVIAFNKRAARKDVLKKILAQSAIWIVLLLMYVPILVLIAFSFTKSDELGVWNGFSFALYDEFFHSEEIMIALGNTLIIAVVSSVISVVLGASGAIGVFYSKRRVRATIEQITQIPVVNPEIVIAISLSLIFGFLSSMFFNGETLLSFWTLLVGHIILSLPFVYLSVKPKLQQLDPALYEAALDLGCTPHQALWKTTIPEILPGIISGFLLSITLSLDDFIVTFFTRGSGLLSGANKIETISTLVQAKIKKGPIPPEMRALTTFLFLAVLLIVIGKTIFDNTKNKKVTRREH